MKAKSELSRLLQALIKHVNALDIKVKFIHCNNTGENKQLQKECISEGIGIEFEFTAPGTPQQNGRCERKIATIFS